MPGDYLTTDPAEDRLVLGSNLQSPSGFPEPLLIVINTFLSFFLSLSLSLSLSVCVLLLLLLFLLICFDFLASVLLCCLIMV